MAQLYVSNINFESTGNNQIVYNANNSVTFRVSGVNVLTVNSTAMSNGAGVTVNYAGWNNNIDSNNSLVANQTFTIVGGLIIDGTITPTPISSNTANWSPGSNVYNIRISGNNSVTNSEYMITGMTAGTNGQIVILNNVGSMGIWIRTEEAGSNGAVIPGVNVPGSTAANRFNLPNHFKLKGFQSAAFYYDGVLNRWRLTDSFDIPFYHKQALVEAFFSGGNTGAVVATADRTTYSTESTSAVTGANLSVARGGLAAAGNACKGFFLGGATPTLSAVADRTNYTTESTAAVTGANLSQARDRLAAGGNACKGFFNGGGTPAAVATSNRVNYLLETSAAVTGTNLIQARFGAGGAGNACKLFFVGGATVATAERVSYATETIAAVPGASLTQARGGVGIAGNADKAFFNGGCTPTAVTTSDRLTYATETTAAVPGAILSVARTFLAGAGNNCKAFFSGGSVVPTFYATADRTTYSSETTSAVLGANISSSRHQLAAV